MRALLPPFLPLPPLLALILGQICLHACMAGVRVALPLMALRSGQSEAAVGVLLALFAAAPVVCSLPAGRFADKHGYHRPVKWGVGMVLTGALLAAASTWFAGVQFAVACVAATLCGVGTNFGLIAIQRTAGRLATGDRAALTRVFSWLGLAPALSNVIGPVLAGAVIDMGGFRCAFIVLSVLPLGALWFARQVPAEGAAAASRAGPPRASGELLALPGMRRLLFVNFLMSASWDLHAFVVPVLGHERAFSATAIGLILGCFAAAVASVRFVIPFLSHRLREHQVLAGAMLFTAAVFAVYPFVQAAWLMAFCAALLGLALGAVNPMIMTSLHHLTPADRHGEAIALRSMTINSGSAVMPLLFGAAGAAIGAGTLFWLMGAAVAAGSVQARQLGRYLQAAPSEADARRVGR